MKITKTACWDYFSIFGATYFCIVLSFLNGDQVPSIFYHPIIIGAVSFPHFFVSYYVWWKQRESFSKEWTVWASGALCGSFLAGLYWFQNDQYTGWFVQFLYLYLFYHFARQLYGVTLWSSYRRKIHFPKMKKHLLNALFLLFAVNLFVGMQFKGSEIKLFYFSAQTLPISFQWASVLFYSLVGVFSLFFVYDFWLWYKRKPSLNHFFSYLVIFSGAFWFIPHLQPRNFFLALPVLHGLQYTPFWGRVAGKQMGWKRMAVFYMSAVAAGYFALNLTPSLLSKTMDPPYYGYMTLFAFFNFHHFFIDGRIWKLRNQKNVLLFESRSSSSRKSEPSIAERKKEKAS